jgi:hypothetical protein
MSKTKPTDTRIVDASPTTADLADTDPTTAAPPKVGKLRRRKRVMASVALAAAAVAGAFTMTGAATAASAQEDYYQDVLVSPTWSFGYMELDVSGASLATFAPVIQWWINGNANQRWNFRQLPDGNFWIINANSGQCLTTDLVAGDQLFQDLCGFPGTPGVGNVDNPNGQEWYFDGGAGIVNAETGLYVDIYGGQGGAGSPIDAWYYNGNSNQDFQILS